MANLSKIEGTILGVIFLVVLFKVLVQMIPELNTAGNELNATGVPFGSLFVSNGLIVLILMVGVVMTAIKIFGSTSK